MSKLGRRRFSAGALAAGAAFVLPRVARAHATLTPSLVARRHGDALEVTLRLRASERVSVPTHALALDVRVGSRAVAMSNPEFDFMRRSRAGYRLGPPITLTSEARDYVQLRGPWPGGDRERVHVTIAIHPRAAHQPTVRDAFASVAGWSGDVELA